MKHIVSVLIFLGLLSSSFISYGKDSFPNIQQKNGETVYSLDELVSILKNENFMVKENAERVYRAKHQIYMAIGRLLPSLNFSIVQSVVERDYYDIASALLGFLFPSNWFRWRESKYYFEAEKQSFMALVANEVNALESMYYEVLFIKDSIAIYNLHLEQIKNFVDQLIERVHKGEELINEQVQLENMYILLKKDLIQLNKTYLTMLSQLAYAVGLPQKNWHSFKLKEISLPRFSSISQSDHHTLYSTAIDRSPELKQLHYLKKAVRFSIARRAFAFISPDSSQDEAIGFGYPSYIKIGRSESREVDIKIDEMTANIHKAVDRALADSLENQAQYLEAYKGLQNAQTWKNFVTLQFEDGAILDSREMIEAFIEHLTFQNHMLKAQYYYLISKAQIKRLLLEGPYFSDLSKHIPQKPTRLSLRKRLENKRIKQDATEI